MGIHSKETPSNIQSCFKQVSKTSKNLKMFNFIVTVLATTAVLTEAAPGGGYYKHKSHGGHHGYKKPAPPATRTAAPGDLVDVAVGAGKFTTLVKLVSDLGLVETLKGVEAATIFAPSDDAFAKLPEGTLESLTPEQAKAIVAQHVVAGATVMAADVTTGPVTTFGGNDIDLIKDDAGVGVVGPSGNRVNVVTADVEASNGVIHVVDAVIL